MTTENKTARLAGLLYLVVVVTGVFSLGYVPSHVALSDDPHSTAANILASESLFRAGIAAFIVKQVAFLLLPLVLFRLLKSAGEVMAMSMVALAAVSVPIALVSLSSKLDVVSLLTEPRYSAVLTPEQLQAEMLLMLGKYRSGPAGHQPLLGPVAVSAWLPDLQIRLATQAARNPPDAWMLRLPPFRVHQRAVARKLRHRFIPLDTVAGLGGRDRNLSLAARHGRPQASADRCRKGRSRSSFLMKPSNAA